LSKLVLLRHGQSEWNKKNLFTGWVDVPLSKTGIDEAFNAGKLIRNTSIDVIFTSTLIRAQMTAMLALVGHTSKKIPVILHPESVRLDTWGQICSEHSKQETIPTICAWELNERMYGDLQGLNKAETIEKFGEAQVKKWRRSFSERPPNGESLEMTAERTLPYYTHIILPMLKQDINILVSAHGNSLRAIIMHIENISKDEIINLEIETGKPMFYEYRHPNQPLARINN